MEFSKSVDFCHFNGHIFDEEVLHQFDFYLCEQKKNAFMITDKKDRENQTTRSCQLILFRHFRDILICTYKLDDLRHGGNTLHKIQEF